MNRFFYVFPVILTLFLLKKKAEFIEEFLFICNRNKYPMSTCFCNTSKPFSECCEPYILGHQKAPTAETLMRSRYSAYCVCNADYLMATTHFSTRKFHDKAETLAFATQNQWVKLEIITSSEKIVEFKAYYVDNNLQPQTHHEKSTFRQEEGSWYYVDGEWF